MTTTKGFVRLSSINEGGGQRSQVSRPRSGLATHNKPDLMLPLSIKTTQATYNPVTRPRTSQDHRRIVREKNFLKEVQHELEDKRSEWTDEVDRMSSNPRVLMRTSSSSPTRGPSRTSSVSSDASSYVEHDSYGNHVFKAFVDVSEYPPSTIDLTMDTLQNKMVVSAQGKDSDDNMHTFTQKVQLPKFADHQRTNAKMTKDGMLTLTVPLIFYSEPEKKQSKAFINKVQTDSDGNKFLEILVNMTGVSPKEVKVRANKQKELAVHVERKRLLSDGSVAKHRELLRRFKLPDQADITGITSSIGEDNRLSVIVPINSTPLPSPTT